jgi:hypothetical protein
MIGPKMQNFGLMGGEYLVKVAKLVNTVDIRLNAILLKCFIFLS